MPLYTLLSVYVSILKNKHKILYKDYQSQHISENCIEIS